MPVSACCRVLGQVKKSDGMVGSPLGQAGARSVSRSPAPAWVLSVMAVVYACWRGIATDVLGWGITLVGDGRCGGGSDVHAHGAPRGHHSLQGLTRSAMDCRVKPGNDGVDRVVRIAQARRVLDRPPAPGADDDSE
jgi:hypothetical protein